MDKEDRVVQLYWELSEKLMREYSITPEQLARIATGLAVHLHVQFHADGAKGAAAHLRESADALDRLGMQPPPSSLN